MATPHSRKNSRVFRSPDMSEAVPQAKIKVEVKEEPNTFMDIDADDEEAGTILMALAQDSERRRSNNEKMMLPFYDEKPSRSHSMCIKNLLDTDHSTQPSPYTSLSSGVISRGPSFINTASKSTPPDRRKKGFQVINPSYFKREQDDHYNNNSRYLYNIRSFRHPSEVHVPPMRHNGHSKLRRNAIHIHISYRIHAHRNKVTTPMYGRNDHYQQPRIDWHPAPFHYQQDTV